MKHIKTFYQTIDTEEVLCTIEDVLVSLPNGSDVWFKDKNIRLMTLLITFWITMLFIGVFG